MSLPLCGRLPTPDPGSQGTVTPVTSPPKVLWNEPSRAMSRRSSSVCVCDSLTNKHYANASPLLTNPWCCPNY